VVSPAPPAYAWDWLARQRVVWQEIRRRLIVACESRPDVSTRPGDVPDWSAEHPDVVAARRTPASDPSPARSEAAHDYRALGTRAEVVAALRLDYRSDAQVRATVDTVVGEVAFLGRLDVPLSELGVRSAPRGMQWWWSQLTGLRSEPAPSGEHEDSEPPSSLPLQLRLVDVLAGYGDATGL
jgi:hypothetical protein